jgi:chaperonin GroES
MSVNFKPLNYRVLIEREEAPDKSESGLIHIPEKAKEEPILGTIVAVHESEDGSAVEVGDKVVFGKYSGTVISIDGNPYTCMLEEDLFGVVGGDE